MFRSGDDVHGGENTLNFSTFQNRGCCTMGSWAVTVLLTGFANLLLLASLVLLIRTKSRARCSLSYTFPGSASML